MNSFQFRRNISFILVVCNLVVFLLTYLSNGLWVFLSLNPLTLIQYRFFWTPLTYMFTHGGFNHLLFNMVFLIFVGPAVEERMGWLEFLVFYLLSGILSGLFSTLIYWATGTMSSIVGASGALYSVMLAFAAYYPRARFYLFYILPMKAPHAILLFTVLDLLNHFTGVGNVAYLTHLSGLAFGFLYFVIRLGINPIKEMRQGL